MSVLLLKTLRKAPLHQGSAGRIFSLLFLLCVSVFFSLPLFAQNNITVKGRVRDANGQGVAKATVAIKGSTTATSADDLGNFEITAPSNGTLVISAIGFSPQEIKIN